MPKKRLLATILLAAAFIALTTNATAYSIGTAPGVLDLGEIERGQSKEFEFYLITTADHDVIVGLSPIKVHEGFFRQNATVGAYNFTPSEASQLDPGNWLTIRRDPVIVSPKNSFILHLADGSVVKANAKAELEIKVPDDAEPCYYAGSVNLIPQEIPGQGIGVQTIGVTRFMYVFRVPGNGYRKGEITDIQAEREAQDKVRIDMVFKNTGTCTLIPWADQAEIFNNLDNLASTTYSGPTIVKPREVAILSTYWVDTKKDIESGIYRVVARVEYITDYAYREQTVNVPKIISAPRIRPTAQGCYFPWWILLVLIGLFLIVYAVGALQLAYTALLAFIICGLFTVVGLFVCPNDIPVRWILIELIVILIVVYWKT
ncbi:Uncharacterised protein [uncultured archaeon]|nr:Uncharacterised protein [uncultured archaeon]